MTPMEVSNLSQKSTEHLEFLPKPCLALFNHEAGEVRLIPAGCGRESLDFLLHRFAENGTCEAFASETGPLTDTSAEGGERVGRMELFAGAIASYKNSHSHRDVDLDNPSEAIKIILIYPSEPTKTRSSKLERQLGPKAPVLKIL
jgi:hypothetical protein